jgi:hypothetical protein
MVSPNSTGYAVLLLFEQAKIGFLVDSPVPTHITYQYTAGCFAVQNTLKTTTFHLM